MTRSRRGRPSKGPTMMATMPPPSRVRCWHRLLAPRGVLLPALHELTTILPTPPT
ncbi:MAG: hypothetical protein AVDCRST_MAG18-1528 [uncultured Thermomicrobiales bacterium]|uniref:Uncharacterized protein n=1 Tax=uncultured Thermomicrobiales bacterium TaxID=1645740 RepID=A0A6J4V330_9BACT|nr:MAG: hypothetical protein AVDCRST_MAG18-1528 [uncultured Thermomicrobiales bacterium]